MLHDSMDMKHLDEANPLRHKIEQMLPGMKAGKKQDEASQEFIARIQARDGRSLDKSGNHSVGEGRDQILDVF